MPLGPAREYSRYWECRLHIPPQPDNNWRKTVAVAAIVPVDVAVAPGKLKPPNLASRVPPPPAASTPACGLIFARAGNNAASPRVLLEGLVGRTTESQRRLPPPQHAHTPTQTHMTQTPHPTYSYTHSFHPIHICLLTEHRREIIYTIPFRHSPEADLSLSLSLSLPISAVHTCGGPGRSRTRTPLCSRITAGASAGIRAAGSASSPSPP